jgi:NADP-dependent 3-hydroxy acid dehydrogenase YdfG
MKIETGQVAVVTGAASGIGLAISTALVARGLHVVMADIDAARLDAAAGQVSVDATATKPTDVADGEAVAALRDFALDKFGRVDLVFNNAGVTLPFAPMWEYSRSDWEWLLGINLWGVVNGIQAFVPYLVERGSGHVINTASMAGVGIIPRNGAYNAAKHAVVSLSETLNAELASAGTDLHASVLIPGLVPTRIAESSGRRPQTSAQQPPGSTTPPLAEAEKYTVSSEDVARRTLAGIEANRTYIFSNPGSENLVEDRFSRIKSDLKSFS